ncbi:hypothetical protein GBA52_008371 [Prunus armeniaca]|nr:hypothetical protein GBA52_008371 [Prunus armeniaca]
MVRELVFSLIRQTQTQAVVYGAARTMGVSLHKPRSCTFFHWIDPKMCERLRNVIIELLKSFSKHEEGQRKASRRAGNLEIIPVIFLKHSPQHESKPHPHPQPTVPVTIHLQPTIPAPFPHDLTTRSRNTSSLSKIPSNLNLTNSKSNNRKRPITLPLYNQNPISNKPN